MKAEIEPSETGKPDGASQTKQWVLVGILSVGLVGALYLSPADDSELEISAADPDNDPAGNVTQASLDAETEDPEAKLDPDVTRIRQFPRMEIDRIVHLNPLSAGLLASEAEAEAAESDAAADREPSEEEEPDRSETAETESVEPPRPKKRSPPVQVQAIYGSDRDAAALVEKKIVRRGEPLSDGRTVLDVSKEGVRVTGEALSELELPNGKLEIYDFGSD